MAKSIEDARIVLKRSTVALAVPTVAPDNDHTSGTWSVNDIYKGEIYINTVDGKIYTRTDAGIIQIGTFVTNGTDIVMSSGDNITSADGTNTIALSNSGLIVTATDGTNIAQVEVSDSGSIELSNTDGVTTGRLQVLPVGVRINNDYVLPTVDGSNGQIIQTDGFGALSFVTPASGISGLTTNELVYGNSDTTIASLPVATYPSLTEISYVKGLTSSAQTQLTAKAPLASPTFTGIPAAPTATVGTNTTQIATTAFVVSQIAVTQTNMFEYYNIY